MNRVKNDKGFTLAELLVVIAIIAVLIAIAIPVFNAQTEKARNAVDMHNAKLIADSISLYFLSNPDALEKLQEQCDVLGSNHCVQVEVMSNTTMAPVLQPALLEAGLIDCIDTSPAKRFTELTCKSKINWVGYRVVVSTYNNMEPGELQIRFWGLKPGTNGHSINSWGMYKNPDSTGFKDAMGSTS